MMHEQSCFLIYLTYYFFDVLDAVADAFVDSYPLMSTQMIRKGVYTSTDPAPHGPITVAETSVLSRTVLRIISRVQFSLFICQKKKITKMLVKN